MITSHTNKGVKEVIQLAQKAKARKEKGLFIVEGVKMFLEAPAEAVVKVYLSESFLCRMLDTCREKLNTLPCAYETASDEVFGRMSDTKTPQGVLCVLKQPHYRIEEMTSVSNPFLALLEDIQDPGNLGTILRAGEGAGITGVIMSENTADIYNPKTIRSTMGSIYRVPFFYTSDMGETIEELHRKNITVYAACLQGAKDYDNYRYETGTAFLIGNEANGLREETIRKADAAVKIPMLGKVESLNAAVAASVLMFEAARQRKN
ncbi:MAG: RNA methyltransferase [Clostridium sp.]|nr:RNA methyltransferase [Clostridium sp.]